AAMTLSLGARAPRSRRAFLKPKVLKCQAFKRQVVKRQVLKRQALKCQVFTHQVLDPQAAPIRAAVTSELWHAMVTIACRDAYPAWGDHRPPSGSRPASAAACGREWRRRPACAAPARCRRRS